MLLSLAIFMRDYIVIVSVGLIFRLPIIVEGQLPIMGNRMIVNMAWEIALDRCGCPVNQSACGSTGTMQINGASKI